MKFKVGQKVKTVNPYSGSDFEDGEIVEIVRIGTEDGEDMNCYGAKSEKDPFMMWYLYEDEVAPITNADKIRIMSNDELADFLSKIDNLEAICNSCPHNDEDYCLLDMSMDKCVVGFKNWLTKEC